MDVRDAEPSRDVDLGEVFTTSFRLVKANARVFVGLATVFFGVPTAVMSVLTLALLLALPTIATPPDPADPFSGEVFPPELADLMAGLFTWGLASLGVITIGTFCYVVGQTALTKATLDACEGREVSLASAVAVPVRGYVSTLVATTTIWSLVSLGFLCCCLPGLPLLVIFFFAPALIVHRGVHGLVSLVESTALARKNAFATSLVMGVLGAAWLVNYALQQGLTSPIQALVRDDYVRHGGSGLASVTPFVVGVGSVYVLAVVLLAVVHMLLFQVVPTVLYVRLVAPRLVNDPERLERVFE